MPTRTPWHVRLGNAAAQPQEELAVLAAREGQAKALFGGFTPRQPAVALVQILGEHHPTEEKEAKEGDQWRANVSGALRQFWRP